MFELPDFRHTRVSAVLVGEGFVWHSLARAGSSTIVVRFIVSRRVTLYAAVHPRLVRTDLGLPRCAQRGTLPVCQDDSVVLRGEQANAQAVRRYALPIA